MKNYRMKDHRMSATDCLDRFSYLSEGAQLAAAAELYGGEYEDFIEALAREAERKGENAVRPD